MLNDTERDYLQGLLNSSLAGCVTSLGGVQDSSAQQWNELRSCTDARLCVLTLSGYSLRCLVCLLVDSSSAASSLGDDELQELANNVCGTLKRYLGVGSFQLGMSTPNMLPVACMSYLSRAEQPVLTVQALTADGNQLHAGLLLLQVDESWAPPAAVLNNPQPEALGELELF